MEELAGEKSLEYQGDTLKIGPGLKLVDNVIQVDMEYIMKMVYPDTDEE